MRTMWNLTQGETIVSTGGRVLVRLSSYGPRLRIIGTNECTLQIENVFSTRIAYKLVRSHNQTNEKCEFIESGEINHVTVIPERYELVFCYANLAGPATNCKTAKEFWSVMDDSDISQFCYKRRFKITYEYSGGGGGGVLSNRSFNLNEFEKRSNPLMSHRKRIVNHVGFMSTRSSRHESEQKDKSSADKRTNGNRSVDKTSGGKQTNGKRTADKSPAEKQTHGNCSADKGTADKQADGKHTTDKSASGKHTDANRSVNKQSTAQNEIAAAAAKQNESVTINEVLAALNDNDKKNGKKVTSTTEFEPQKEYKHEKEDSSRFPLVVPEQYKNLSGDRRLTRKSVSIERGSNKRVSDIVNKIENVEKMQGPVSPIIRNKQKEVTTTTITAPKEATAAQGKDKESGTVSVKGKEGKSATPARGKEGTAPAASGTKAKRNGRGERSVKEKRAKERRVWFQDQMRKMGASSGKSYNG